MRIEHIRQRLRCLGAKPCHEQRLLQAWLRSMSVDTRRRRAEDFIPLRTREALSALTARLHGLVRLRSEHLGEAGSTRLLLALADDQTVETVLLRRGALCVSTQVGCAVGCVFCMTGRSDLLRQLGSAEIVARWPSPARGGRCAGWY